MKRKNALFILGGLVFCLALAGLVSPWASSRPDGLERVAQDLGFLAKAEGKSSWKSSPLPDYAVPGVKREGFSTALAGVCGVLAVFGLALGVSKFLGRRSR